MESQLSVDAGLAPTDVDALERLRRFGGGKLLGDMIALFLVSAPERIAAARAATVAQNLGSTESALHSLKSSSAQLGAMRMHRLCDAGERRTRDGSFDGVPALIDELEHEFARIREWLTNARDERTP